MIIELNKDKELKAYKPLGDDAGKPRYMRIKGAPGLILAQNKRSVVFKVQFALHRNGKYVRTVRMTLGDISDLTVNTAKARARELRDGISSGNDPKDKDDPVAVANWTLEHLWDVHATDLKRRGKSGRTIKEFEAQLNRYFEKWKKKRLCEITSSMVQRKFNEITDNPEGEKPRPIAANHAVKAFKTAWNRSARPHSDHTDPLPLQYNPAASVSFHPTPARSNVLLPDELPAWWKTTGELANPLRGQMHRLGLLTGLRPGNLMSIEKDWIDFTGRAIRFPASAMKRRAKFDLPLSDALTALIARAIGEGDKLYPGSPFLFPTKASGVGPVIATSTIRERTMPQKTGHLLRRTYKSLALAAGVTDFNSGLLLHHKTGTISDVYTVPAVLHDSLIKQQKIISKYILDLADA